MWCKKAGNFWSKCFYSFWRKGLYALIAIGLLLAISCMSIFNRSPLHLSWGEAGAKVAPTVPQVLNDTTFKIWRDFIHPSKDELVWERIYWYTTLWDGLMVAQEQQKPLMFQSMTGHPCGTT